MTGPAIGSRLRHAGREITTMFDLLGTAEDGLTLGIAWALRMCRGFARAVLSELVGFPVTGEHIEIHFHRHERGGGITDLEIVSDNAVHVIIEAKLGWALPGSEQLTRYRRRAGFSEHRPFRVIATLSECSAAFACARLPEAIDGVRVRHLGWRRLVTLAHAAAPDSSHAEKRILRELITHVEGRMSSLGRNSNRVYVVALGNAVIPGTAMTWIDVVTRHQRYFHPIGSGYPREPVPYIAFRYGGRLQSIHHVDDHLIVDDLFDALSGLPAGTVPLHLVYALGPAIVPRHEVRAGPRVRQSARVWCEIDLLLTCRTLSEALDETERRGANPTQGQVA